MKAILGKKIGMTQMFTENKVIPVTLIEAGPCMVIGQKTQENDGYNASQIGFEELKARKQRKSAQGKQYRFVKEFRNRKEVEAPLQVGEVLSVSLFQEGDTVKVSGITKGRGFQGGVKRWGLKGRNATHGVKHEERAIGSVGMSFPERVTKGKKMPGHMGAVRVSLPHVRIVKIDQEKNLLAVRGAVPGRKGTLLEISAV